MSRKHGGLLNGKKAIVTGATSGIGYATAYLFAINGAEVIATGRNEDKGMDLVSSINKSGRKAYFIKADLTKRDDLDLLVEEAIKKLGRIDILVNNAGVEILKDIDETELDEFTSLYKVNLFAPFYLMKKVIPHMRENNGGVIINVASTAGLSPYPGGGAYCSSKAALISLSKVAALENSKYGIRVVAFAPGLVQTRMFFEGVPEDKREEYVRETAKKVPLGRIALPEDIAEILVFLASDKAWYITGSIVVADGGLITGRRESGNVPPEGKK
jgi:NAD(P)-dependent dehydrogenase (short-subunit alcohol dehydrogenase family)